MSRDLYSRTLAAQSLRPVAITSSAKDSGNVDLFGFEGALVVVSFGDIDEMGASPVGGAQIAVKAEHADDDGTGSAGSYTNAAAADIVGLTPSSGIVATVTTDVSPVQFSYVGGKRFLKVTLTPTSLTNGGPVAITIVKNGARHQSPHDTQV